MLPDSCEVLIEKGVPIEKGKPVEMENTGVPIEKAQVARKTSK